MCLQVNNISWTIKHFSLLKTTFWNKIDKKTKQRILSSFTIITELLSQKGKRKTQKENCNNLTKRMSYHHGNLNELPIWSVPTQRSDIMIAIRPDHTKTMVGVLPFLPIKPFAKGWR